MNCLDHHSLLGCTHRGVTRQEITVFSKVLWVSVICDPDEDPQDADPTTLRYDSHSSNVVLINQIIS